MTSAVLSLLFGVVLAGAGGELFLRGVLGLARWRRIPPAIAAATFGAFATSSPEMFVSTIAAVNGEPAIGLGDALGSNVVNIALILGIALLIKPLITQRKVIALDSSTAIGATVAVGLVSLDGVISRLDGLLLILGWAVWMTLHVMAARRQRGEQGIAPDSRPWLIAAQGFGGLAMLIAAGVLVVGGATTIAESFGISPYLIGVTLVALGTSMPELAITLIAVFRGHDEVGVGGLLGSNVFNALFIVGIAATITPIATGGPALWIALGAGALAVLCVWPASAGVLGRARGVTLILVYALTISLLGVFAG